MKNNYIKNSIIAAFLSTSLFICAQQDDVYKNNFENVTTGIYNKDRAKSELGFPSCKGADEGRVSVENFSGQGKVLKIKYPKGKVKTGESGFFSKVNLSGEYEELFFSYKVYIPSDFEFRAGAKMPGLAHQPSNGKKNTSLRLMWRYDGLVEYYLHYRTKPATSIQVNWTLTDPYDQDNEPLSDHVRLKKGAWNTIEMQIKLNTPGVKNGIMRGWLNGQLAIDITNNGDYRLSGDTDIKLNQIYMTSFFGGSDENFQPTKDQYAYFDDFVVSKNRLGNSGGNGDDNTAPKVEITSPASNQTYKLGEIINLVAKASDTEGSIEKVDFKINNNFYKTDSSAPYSINWEPTSVGTYTISAKAFESGQEGLATETSINIILKNDDGNEGSSGCDFNTPIKKGLSAMEKITYSNVHVLGTDGPVLSNFRKFTINWAPQNNKLNQFAINTNNGSPDWYVDFKNTMSFQLKNAKPEVTLKNTGFSGLDGDYWVTKDGANFVMRSKNKNFSIYFSNSNTAPNCQNKLHQLLIAQKINIYPNPSSATIQLQGVFDKNIDVDIVDMYGRKIKSAITSENKTINISDLNKGYYFLILKGRKSIPFIKQ